MAAEVAGLSEWKIEVNIAGVAPLKPGVTMLHVEDGAYQGKIIGALLVAQKKDANKRNVMFTIQHLESTVGSDGVSYKGREHRVYVPVSRLLTNAEINALGDAEKRAYTFNQAQWRTILESIGAPPERLDANPACAVSNDLFANGRSCFFHVQNPPEGALTEAGGKKYEDVAFCNAAHYKKMREVATLATTGVSVAETPQLQFQTQQPPAALGNLGSLLGAVTSAATGSPAGNGIPVLRL